MTRSDGTDRKAEPAALAATTGAEVRQEAGQAVWATRPDVVDVIGVGADGVAGLALAQKQLLEAAEVVAGGERHLAMLGSTEGRRLVSWPTPLRPQLAGLVESWRGRRVVVLASGDPLVSGIGTTLVDVLGADRVRVHPAVSSAALARARLGWSAEGSAVVSLVGRDLGRLRRDLSPRARLVVLTTGADAPDRIAALLTEEGYGDSRLTVLGDLGSPRESRLDGVAASWDGRLAPRLHLVCVECEATPGGRSPRSVVPGLPDAAYEHDGQLTKRVVRAAALAHLAPQPGDVMWDLGAGAGSVGIEFARQHPRNQVFAVERDPARAARIRLNASALGVPGLDIVERTVATALADLPEPDAVFIGGGATTEVIEAAWKALAAGGRLVVHGVTVETEAVVLDARARLGGSMTRIAVDDLEPLGNLTGWKPARAITQWSITKEDRP